MDATVAGPHSQEAEKDDSAVAGPHSQEGDGCCHSAFAPFPFFFSSLM